MTTKGGQSVEDGQAKPAIYAGDHENAVGVLGDAIR